MLLHLSLALLVSWPELATGVGDGVWEEWLDWSSCSVSCGVGTQKRVRTCTLSGRPGGKWCEGQYVDNKACDTGVRCPVDGGWSAWSDWRGCSVSCGEGTKERYRSCSNPIPEEGGKKCRGNNKETSNCVALKQCPRDGGWSPWSQWSKCSVTCGEGGAIHRYRACNDPPPVAEGKPCSGEMHETKACKALVHCPVNGQWSDWSDWTPCSKTCGHGSRSRQRACDRPPPQHGGKDCDRTDAGELQTISCTAAILHCPVDGGWSAWSDWRECRTPDCGSPDAPFYSFRHRSCNAPLPKHNGSMCEGAFVDSGICAQPLNCKVDGGWGEWSQWNCTGSEFLATRLRTCDSPAPANGGKGCRGVGFQFVQREDKKAYREACPQIVSDDEDLGEGSGIQEASGDESLDDEEEDDEDE